MGQVWNSLIKMKEGPRSAVIISWAFSCWCPGLPQPGQRTNIHLINRQQRLTTYLNSLDRCPRNIARKLNQPGPGRGNPPRDSLKTTCTASNPEAGVIASSLKNNDNYVSILKGAGYPTGRVADALAYFEEKLWSLAARNSAGYGKFSMYVPAV